MCAGQRRYCAKVGEVEFRWDKTRGVLGINSHEHCLLRIEGLNSSHVLWFRAPLVPFFDIHIEGGRPPE